MKYMCGGPVRKATGGMIKSAAPKGASNALTMAPKGGAPKAAKTTGAAASLSSALGTLSAASKTPKSAAPKSVAKPSDLGSKRFIDQTRPEFVREAPRPTMEPKRQVQPTPPKDVKTIGGAPKAPKGAPSGGTFMPWDNASPKEAPVIQKKYQDAEKTMTPSAYKKFAENASRPATSPQDAKTIGGAPKAPKDAGRELPRPTMEPKRLIAQTPPDDVRTIGGAPKNAKTMGSVSPAAKTMGNAPKAAKTMGSVSPAAKTMGNAPKAMKGVPVASKKPMIGQFKTGGYVSKSTFKW